jgi:hypothetical protein
MKTEPSEFQKFDAALTKSLSISHDELVRRDAKWKKQQKRKKTKSSR